MKKEEKEVKVTKKEAKPIKKATIKPSKVKTTKNKGKITKDMLLGDIMEMKPKAGEVFMGFGLHCFGCPMAAMETLEEVAELYEINLELMLKKLNEL